jgi:hypothetical protein
LAHGYLGLTGISPCGTEALDVEQDQHSAVLVGGWGLADTQLAWAARVLIATLRYAHLMANAG